jgi:hypothetical protein
MMVRVYYSFKGDTKMECNIDMADRKNRVVIGIIILLAAILGFGKFFFALVGIALIVEGVIGWCAIPVIMDKFKDKTPK